MLPILEIVHSINRNGRQGPRDLKSDEVYEWVYQDHHIPKDAYLRLLEENAIPEAQRSELRDAWFTVSQDGKYSLFKSSELELRPYICYVLSRQPGLTSAGVKEAVKLIYPSFTLTDLIYQQNLATPQQIVDQTIRNIMVSNYTKQANYRLFYRSATKPYTYTLTDEGKLLAAGVTGQELDLDIPEEPEDNPLEPRVYSEEELEALREQNKSFSLLTTMPIVSTGRPRYPVDRNLGYTRMTHKGFLCELGPEHSTFPTSRLPNYLEEHHVIPQAAQKNLPTIKLDCMENLAVLCPICHAALHYAEPQIRVGYVRRLLAFKLDELELIGIGREQAYSLCQLYYGVDLPEAQALSPV